MIDTTSPSADWPGHARLLWHSLRTHTKTPSMQTECEAKFDSVINTQSRIVFQQLHINRSRFVVQFNKCHVLLYQKF